MKKIKILMIFTSVIVGSLLIMESYNSGIDENASTTLNATSVKDDF